MLRSRVIILQGSGAESLIKIARHHCFKQPFYSFCLFKTYFSWSPFIEFLIIMPKNLLNIFNYPSPLLKFIPWRNFCHPEPRMLTYVWRKRASPASHRCIPRRQNFILLEKETELFFETVVVKDLLKLLGKDLLR